MQAVPSVDEVFRTMTGRSVIESFGHRVALQLVRESIETARSQMNGAIRREAAVELVESILVSLKERRVKGSLTRVVNATGVIIHTNLGRSMLSEAAVAAVAETSAGYCNVELALETGERGRRGRSAEKLLAEVAGAEDGLIVNNCAAAAMLTLSTLAEGGEVIVSRGELVEIGGDFRIPEVLERSGCRLREVGTTNRTKLADYERAISADTKAILRVHPSNYRITGFTMKPQLSELAGLARAKQIVMIEDAGSGAMLDLSEFGLGDEPVISDAVAAGADIVTFSGDKLMGGVQAGMIVGNKELIKKIRVNPLYRALRADKLVYAAVEATLMAFARDAAFREIPTLRMLSTGLEELERRAERFKADFDKNNRGDVSLTLVNGFSAIGGGTGPGVKLPSRLIAITHREISANDISEYLRSFTPPIITRIEDERIMVDLRTIPESDGAVLLDAISQLSTGSRRQTHA